MASIFLNEGSFPLVPPPPIYVLHTRYRTRANTEKWTPRNTAFKHPEDLLRLYFAYPYWLRPKALFFLWITISAYNIIFQTLCQELANEILAFSCFGSFGSLSNEKEPPRKRIFYPNLWNFFQRSGNMFQTHWENIPMALPHWKIHYKIN